MSRIAVLPEAVIRRIAAGEVVERPVSVVKELVENSLDAGARQITVEIDGGGIDRIAIADDGCGMARDEVAIAFERHATSKIRSDEELESVASLGFRGEALPSIAAVAHVELTTRRAEDEVGTRIEILGGTEPVVAAAGGPVGTRIEIRDLFAHTPARRKFLKRAATEGGHVAQMLGRIALARCDVGFRLEQDGRETLALAPSDLRTRARRLFGTEVGEALQPVSVDGRVRVDGLASHPHFHLASQRAVAFYVNGRTVKDRLLNHALREAYRRLLPDGRFPAAVLFLTFEAGDVDVNAHPAKLEVRFRDASPVFEALRRAVRQAAGAEATPAGAAERVAEGVADPRAIYRPTPLPTSGGSTSGHLRLVPRGSDDEAAQAVLEGEAGTSGLTPGLSGVTQLRILGQIFAGYVVCEGQGELVLIDQHAAHERVAFERLRADRRKGPIETQPLLVPESVDLGVGQCAALLEATDELARLGLEIDAFGEDAIAVRAVPALLPPREIRPMLEALAQDLGESGRSSAIETVEDRLLATIACHSVVRVGQSLSEPEIRSLFEQMESIDLRTNCPHGRPVARRFARGEVERFFGR